jgi:hypothetical protein
MYVTIGTLQKKVKNLTLTVREFNKRIVPACDMSFGGGARRRKTVGQVHLS